LQGLQVAVSRCRNRALAEPAACVIDRDERVRALVGINSQDDHGWSFHPFGHV